MNQLNTFLDFARDAVRRRMNVIASFLDRISHGRLHPNTITYIGFFMHLPIAYLIATGNFVVGALLLIVFGLFDALDGALARTQKRDSAGGMLLDASTDRMKEVILYVGVAYVLVSQDAAIGAVWAVAACGSSICVSYVKAKGEAAIASTSDVSASEINSLFKDGLLRFEVRMFILVVGLLFSQLVPALVVITLLSTYTAFDRLIKISKALES